MATRIMEHKTVSLADQVFEQLETDILSGKYPKGEVLTELKLTAEMGVSRTPVREALRRLQAEHIIEESAKGMVVMGISKQDLADIFEIRAHLEGLTARKAAENICSQTSWVRSSAEAASPVFPRAHRSRGRAYSSTHAEN